MRARKLILKHICSTLKKCDLGISYSEKKDRLIPVLLRIECEKFYFTTMLTSLLGTTISLTTVLPSV